MPDSDPVEHVEVVGGDGASIEIPTALPLLPVRDTVVFPGVTRPLAVGRVASIAALEAAGPGGFLIVATQLDPETEEPDLDDLYPSACVVRLARAIEGRGHSRQAIVVGVARARITDIIERDPALLVRLEAISEIPGSGPEHDSLWQAVIARAHRIIDLRDDLPEEWKAFVSGLPSAGQLTDLVASTLPLPPEEQISLLAEARVDERLERIAVHLDREVTIAKTQRELSASSGAGDDPKRRERLLRKRLRELQNEIGESDPGLEENDTLRERLEAAELPADASEQAERELARFVSLPQQAPERHTLRTYLEWLADLPWNKRTEDKLDLAEARAVLDADHYDLDKVKERILEMLAVRKLAPDAKGAILCFVGPPGVGKTSIGRSIARAMGREFIRASLGGVRDEAEIRGHRRTYVGSMPGRIIQSIKRVGSQNPVFLLDEIDKLGSDFRGDPSSALLEVLDPEQNATFSDHYLEVAFDLSQVLFIATANTLQTIPEALLDRMEVIELPGYTESEKSAIAAKYLVPKQIDAHGLAPDQIVVTDGVLDLLTSGYTREAGVRNLDRSIASLMRKAARKIAEEVATPITLDAAFVKEGLGAPLYRGEQRERELEPGVAIGMAKSAAGGDILYLEAKAHPGGKGVRLHITGQLGDVMTESAEAALSWVRANASALGIDAARLRDTEIHLHAPAGAVPKDGPSAGVALVVALVSLLKKQSANASVAITGEISLRGKVLPVGGIKDKLLGAKRAGIEAVILPSRNKKDLHDVPDEVQKDLAIHFADEITDALAIALPED